MKNTIITDLIEAIFLFLLWSFVLTILLSTPFFIMDYISCSQKYEDSYYKFPAWCMVIYEDEYIPESLYQRAFEQNIKLNKNLWKQ